MFLPALPLLILRFYDLLQQFCFFLSPLVILSVWRLSHSLLQTQNLTRIFSLLSLCLITVQNTACNKCVCMRVHVHVSGCGLVGQEIL